MRTGNSWNYDSALLVVGPRQIRNAVVGNVQRENHLNQCMGVRILMRMSRGIWVLLLGLVLQNSSHAQLDPVKRRLLQLGYNQPLEGNWPITGYAFYYHNQPEFYATNLNLRLAIAPIYIDSQLGFKSLLGPNTDFAIGLAGGGFGDSYFEIRRGKYIEAESFLGHGGEISSSVYHLFNPARDVPLWGVFRAAAHQYVYTEESGTSDLFEIPDDRVSVNLRTGLRLGGKEPSLTEPLAMELSIWHESRLRTDPERYGFDRDREVESSVHLFWTRGLLSYMIGPSEQIVEVSGTAGTTVNPDRFGAYRLGGMLPFVSEFPLSIPGYFYQELTAEQFALFNAEYSFPLERSKNWRLSTYAATAWVDYLDSLEQPGNWHSGLGGGITYISPTGSWFVTLVYSYGFDAIRSSGRGTGQIGFLFQYDFEAKRRGKSRWFIPGMNPYRSRAGERIFR